MRQYAGLTPSHGRRAASPLAPRRSTGFTLIELLVVITVIGILAGLTLAAMGGIQQRGARAKAEGEIQALSAAIEDYHRKLGVYPEMDNLYAELTADSKAKKLPEINKTEVFFEPTPGIVNTNSWTFVDPWGDAYIYETNPEKIRNRGFFDLSSKAGGRGEPIRN